MEHIFDLIKMDSSNSGIKVSITESTMMQILHRAMDKAYRKVKSRNGVLERLNEISRFYELAVIQLEGCLNFVQQEKDQDFVLERSQEFLLEDLTEIRDRLQGRLKEVELAISDKDKELVERLGNELKLKKALEINEKELDSLHADLKLEQRKSEGIGELFLSRQASDDSNTGDTEGEFCELKNSVDQQVWNIQQQLEPDYRHRDEKRSGEIDNKKIEQMGSDIGNLKETLDLAFCKMRNAIFLSELGPIEHQWMWNIERGTSAIVIKGSLNDFRENFEEETKMIEMQVSVGFRKQLSDLMSELNCLNNELEHVQLKRSKPKGLLKAKGRFSSESESFGYASLQGCNEGSEEDVSHYDAMMIKNHESIIRKKSEKLNFLTRELLREKPDHPPLRRGRDCVDPRRRIRGVIQSLESLIKWKPGIGDTVGDTRPDSNVEKHGEVKLCSDDQMGKGKSGNYSMEEVWARVNKTSVSQAGNEEPCIMLKQEMVGVESMEEVRAKVNETTSVSQAGNNEEPCSEIRMLKQEIEDANMQTMMMEETYSTILKILVDEFHVEMFNHRIHCLIKDGMYENFIEEMRNEKCEHLTQTLDRVMKFLEEEETLILSACSEIKQQKLCLELAVSLFDELDRNKHFRGLFTNMQNNSKSENIKLEKALQQLELGKALVSELGSQLGINVDNLQCTTTDCSNPSIYIAKDVENVEISMYESLLNPIKELSQTLKSFDRESCIRLGRHMLRLDKIKLQLDVVVELTATIIQKKSLYRKAFIRRCENLQMAETEVDLLGDQVDLLQGLLEKIYVTLRRHSPVLNQYFEVSEMLKLIEKEIGGR